MCGFKVLGKLFRTNEQYVQTFHTNSHLLKGFSKFINKFSWKFSDVFVYEIYKEDIEYFSKFIQASKIKYIPFGYCSQGPQAKNALLNDPKYEKLLERIKNRKVFMTISRIRFFEKRIDVMIEAMRLYKQRNDDFVFVIAGDGEDMDIAESMVMSYGLSDNVVFLGYVDNPELLAQYADVYIVAVVGKSTGVSGMQAISNQVPVIGVQTVSGFKSSSDNNIKESTTAQGLCELLIELDAVENYSEYKSVTKDIADLNCENQKRFTTSYLSLYKEVSDCEAKE